MDFINELLAGFQFNPMAFVDNLYYMGLGMLIIMIVMAVIIGCTVLLNTAATKLADRKKSDKKE